MLHYTYSVVNKKYHFCKQYSMMYSERGITINVKSIRKKLKISSEEIADELGINRQSLFYRLNGKRDWKLPELIKLSQLMKTVSDDDVLEIECGGTWYDVKITSK